MKEKWEVKVKGRKDAISVLSVGRISVRCRTVGIDLTEKLTIPQFSTYREQLPQNGGSNFPERICTNIQKRASLLEAGGRCSQNKGLAGAGGSIPQVPRVLPEKSMVALN